MNIQFATYQFKIQPRENGRAIFDIIRKKYVQLTPEEWVRQHWIHYLVYTKNISKNLMRVEKSLRIGELLKRCDIVLYTNKGNPRLIIECKAETENLTQQTVDQISRYNMALQVPHLIISNGIQHIALQLDADTKTYQNLEEKDVFK